MNRTAHDNDRRGGGPNGFSLVELVFAVGFMGILFMILGPRFDMVAMRTEVSSRELATLLTASRREAVLRQHDVVVAFDTSTSRVRVHRDADVDGVIDTNEDARWYELQTGVVFGRGLAPSLFGTDPITFTQMQGTLPSVTFHRNGSASEEGGVYVTGAGSANQSRYARALSVIRATGRTERYRYLSEASIWRKEF